MTLGLHRVRYWLKHSWRTGPESVRRALVRRLYRITERGLVAALRQLIGARRPCLLMHSSLSSCGTIAGGEKTVIRVVDNFCDVLCLPTHTYCYPPHQRQVGPLYDPRASPSHVGRLTDYYWRLPGVVRSIHPTHSLAARGPGAAELCAGHERCDTPCGRGTPYKQLVERDASVLMFGATMNTHTLFHTAEDAAGCPYLYEPSRYDLRALNYEGVEHRVLMRKQDMEVTRRFEVMEGLLAVEGLLRVRRLGAGMLLFVPSAAAVHTFLLNKMARDPYYLVAHHYKRRRGH
jgi:aminoglycoside 3-N-acetyltransferase